MLAGVRGVGGGGRGARRLHLVRWCEFAGLLVVLCGGEARLLTGFLGVLGGGVAGGVGDVGEWWCG